MNEDDLQVFINGTTTYFTKSSDHEPSVGAPYLMKAAAVEPSDYAGIIGISGKRKGSVYFTASKEMLRTLLSSLGEDDVSHENCCDLVGEVANTISGNARRDFGKDFMISVPVVVAGVLEKIQTPVELRSFIIPITWQKHECQLVICLE